MIDSELDELMGDLQGLTEKQLLRVLRLVDAHRELQAQYAWAKKQRDTLREVIVTLSR